MRSKSRSGSDFFGLPRSDDPQFGRKLGEKNINLLTELRYVAKEVGGLDQAMRMPVEWRRWWIDQMQKEAAQRKDDYDTLSGTKTMDVR